MIHCEKNCQIRMFNIVDMTSSKVGLSNVAKRNTRPSNYINDQTLQQTLQHHQRTLDWPRPPPMSSARGRIGAAAPVLSRAGRILSGSGHRRQCILSRIVPLSTTGPTHHGTPEKNQNEIRKTDTGDRQNVSRSSKKKSTERFRKNSSRKQVGLGRKGKVLNHTEPY